MIRNIEEFKNMQRNSGIPTTKRASNAFNERYGPKAVGDAPASSRYILKNVICLALKNVAGQARTKA